MSYDLYSLNVISHLPQSDNKILKKYCIDSVETIGAFGDEPFEVVFKNHSWQRVQVKLSIDGTDLLTGKEANTSADGDMWLVEPYGKLSLKAWPETTKGGAQFIFTSSDKSVAVGTHGNLSSRGIIAAAVYVEGHAPYVIQNNNGWWTNYWNSGVRIGEPTFGTSKGLNSFDEDKSSVELHDDCSDATMDFMSCDMERSEGPAASAASASSRRLRTVEKAKEALTSADKEAYFQGGGDAKKSSGKLKSLAAVGAGEHVEQNIKHVTGLRQPKFETVVKIKYEWWDDLVTKAKANGITAENPSGFPGDEKQIMSIGTTPRKRGRKAAAVVQPELSRF